MNHMEGEIFETGISLGGKCTKVRIIGEKRFIDEKKEKFWIKSIPICEKLAEEEDVTLCNGCPYQCGSRPVFLKFYTGNQDIIKKSMKNQGENSLLSPYIVKTFGYGENAEECYVAMEYVEGKTLKFLPDILEQKSCSERERVLIKYRLIRQILLCVQDYQMQCKEYQGDGVHMDLKPENFIITNLDDIHKLQIKLSDFEGFTRTNAHMNVFVHSPAYAHPEQMYCFQKGTIPIQAKIEWDYYALGIIFFELLEEEWFFSEEEQEERADNPLEVKKKVEFVKLAQGEVSHEEKKYLQTMIEKMVDTENTWSNTGEILAYFEEMLCTCLSAEEVKYLKSEEYLIEGEKFLSQKPYIRIEIQVNPYENATPIYQSYDLIQGSIIPWYAGINICGDFEEKQEELLGFLYAIGDNAYYFPIQEIEDIERFQSPLKQEDILKYGQVCIRIKKIENNGYPMKRTGGRRNI